MDASSPAILEIGVVLLAAASAGLLLRRFGLPAVIGYMLVGLLVSPFTPGYVADRHQLQLFADIGVVLLLFEVGIEIDPRELRRGRGRLLWIVPFHTVAVAAASTGIAAAAGLAWKGAVILGVSVTLSSSVVVVNVTRSRRRVTNEATRHALLGWSVVQDVTGVAIAAAVLAALGLKSRPPWVSMLLIVAFVFVAVAAARLLPHVLRRVENQPDLFLLFSIAAGLSLAAVGDRVFGIPLALAAFVGGLAIGEGPVTTEARTRLLPFRDVFAVLFFVAVGSLIDPGAIPESLGWIAIVVCLVLAIKGGSIYAVARAVRLPDVSHWQLGLGLGQIGEFSFVLASVGAAKGWIAPHIYTAILSTVVASIAVVTVAVRKPPWHR
ncbi:MAG TPA: cation:proton antiporter [Gaiellaceae bacterium]|nr:cation:proton antiporter [Gaiellaceae bacterium]